MAEKQHVPVLIVGGGPVGLALALALERFGIRSLAVERSATTTDHPKSRGCWVRTMEIFRQWGVEDGIRRRGLAEGTDVFAMLDRLTGREYGRTLPEPRGDQSPTWKSMVAQDAVEEELLKAVQKGAHAAVRYSTEMVDFEDLGDRVRVRVRDVNTGTIETWECDWLVGCDGAGSGTRRAAGIAMDGPPILALMLNEYVRMDLSRFPVAQEAAVIRIIPEDPARPALSLLNTNGADRWLMVMRIGREQDERSPAERDVEIGKFLAPYIGVEGIPTTKISTSVWRMSKQVAATYRKGRVLLAGDAAHRFPPTGGFGLNSGVQDAHNLAWKLAYVMKGLADEKLIDTYDVERRPVAQSNADWSYYNSLRMTMVEQATRSGNQDRIDFWIRDMDNHLHSVGQSLGFAYDAGAVIPDGSTRLAYNPRVYTPIDRPGSRFPHRWMNADRTETTLDWFDQEFVLVTGPEADGWLNAGAAVAPTLTAPLRIVRWPASQEAALEIGCGMGPRGAVLVRPDGHVAWRMAWCPSDPKAELAEAMRTLLSGTAMDHPALAWR